MQYGGARRCLAQFKSALLGRGRDNVSDKHVFSFVGRRQVELDSAVRV